MAGLRGVVTGEEARAVLRMAEAATGAGRRAGGIGLALTVRPLVTRTGDDEASRDAIALAMSAAGRPVAAAGDGGACDARRRRERGSASELGTAVAAERLVAHVTQPVLWEPGVT